MECPSAVTEFLLGLRECTAQPEPDSLVVAAAELGLVILIEDDAERLEPSFHHLQAGFKRVFRKGQLVMIRGDVESRRAGWLSGTFGAFRVIDLIDRLRLEARIDDDLQLPKIILDRENNDRQQIVVGNSVTFDDIHVHLTVRCRPLARLEPRQVTVQGFRNFTQILARLRISILRFQFLNGFGNYANFIRKFTIIEVPQRAREAQPFC